jgi:hypothetical protein
MRAGRVFYPVSIRRREIYFGEQSKENTIKRRKVMEKGNGRNATTFIHVLAISLLMTGFWATAGFSAVTDATKSSVAALAAASNWQGIADMAAADPALSAALGTVLAEIAANNPDQAAAIAAGLASVMPDRAAEIAGAISAAVPSQATAIAGAVATAVPSQATAIAVAVALAAPDQATAIAGAVAAVVPDSGDAITAAVNEATRNREQDRRGDRHEGEPSYGQ